MFSKSAEYALRAISLLAERYPQSVTTRAIAQATRVPDAYLPKIVQALVRGGIVRTQRGVGGGVVLIRPLEDVTILDVVNAVDPIGRINQCPLGLAAHGVKLCPMHARLDAAMELIENAFRESTLAELLADPLDAKVAQQCKFPPGREPK